MPEPRGEALDAEAIGDLAAAMHDGEARFVVERSAWPAWELSLRQWPTLVIRTSQNLAAHPWGTDVVAYDVTFGLDLLNLDPEGPVVRVGAYVRDRLTDQEEEVAAWLNPTDTADRRVLSGLASVPAMAVYLLSFQRAGAGTTCSGGGGIAHLSRDLHASIAEILETTWEMTTQWPEARQRAEAEWASFRMTGETGATSHA